MEGCGGVVVWWKGVKKTGCVGVCIGGGWKKNLKYGVSVLVLAIQDAAVA